MSKKIWLLKTEPNEFSIDDLKERSTNGEPWNGIRNYQARNFMCAMKKGDIALIYHSACSVPAIVGSGTVIKEAYPDTDAIDPDSKYFDPKSSQENNRWSLVDIRFKNKWKKPLPLKELKSVTSLAEMKLIRQSRLSVSPVTADEYDAILALL